MIKNNKSIMLASVVVFSSIFAQSVSAVPTTIFYQNAVGTTVSASYTEAMQTKAQGNNMMFDAIRTALNTALRGGKNITIVDSNSKVIDYTAAMNASKDYKTVLNDVTIPSIVIPTATLTMDSSGVTTAQTETFELLEVY